MTDKTARTILIIEDAPEDRAAYRRFLERDRKHDYTILEAERGAQGLELWREHRPDCVLLDYHLPDRDGLEVLGEVVSEGGADASAIVMLTGMGDTQLAVEAMKAGAHDYLDKNQVSSETLPHAVNNAVEKAALRRQFDEQRDWLAVTLSSIGDAVIATDTAGRVKFLNPVAEALTGWTGAEAEGRPITEVFHIVNEATRDEVESPVEKVLREGAIVGLANHTVLLAKDGREIPIDDSGAPIRDRHGKLRGVVMVFRDITERRRHEQEREGLLRREQRAREQAEQASRLKDEFLATVSHELRTPLHLMLGWVQILRGGRAGPKEVARGLATIERNARAQHQLVEDLLDVSRIITGKLRLDLRPLRFNRVVEIALEAIQPTAGAKSIWLETVFDPLIREFTGDAARLQQVVWNLVSNAVKFTPEGGRVIVRSELAGANIHLSVSDTGKGIAPEFLPYIFDRFSQEDGSYQRKHGGLGLGLAIVRHLVEAHGGEAYVESAGEGCGATFTITLPLRVAGQGDKEARGQGDDLHVSLSPPPLVSPSLQGLRVLVVDDEEDTRRLLAAILQPAGATVQAVGGMEEALAALAEGAYDLLLSDIAMPDHDGYELLREARGRGFASPAIALTALAGAHDRLLALSAGFQMHVPKPVDPSELLLVLASVTGRLSEARGA